MSTKLLDAIRWTFHMTKTQAEEYYRQHKTDTKLLKTIVDGYNQHCHKAFYND